MATKKVPSSDDAPPSSRAMDVRNSWIEIPMDSPPSRRGKRPPPLPSLPGIQVQDDWLEPPSSRGGKAKKPAVQPPPLPGAKPAAAKPVATATPKAAAKSGATTKPSADPFMGMKMPTASKTKAKPSDDDPPPRSRRKA
jgi:hypothetical protein